MKRFKNILCVVSSFDCQDLVERAVVLANNNQALLTIVEVIDDVSSSQLVAKLLSHDELQSKIIDEHKSKLENLIKSRYENIVAQSKILVGSPFLEIIRNNHDLVIKTSKSNQHLGQKIESDDMHIIRKCPCPVWLVKSKVPTFYRSVLAAVDVDNYYPEKELKSRHLLNIQILEMAYSLALSESADLHIVHVSQIIGENLMDRVYKMLPNDEVISYAEEVKQEHKQSLNILISEVGKDALDYPKPQIHLIKGIPKEEIPTLAQKVNADLLVMGTVARTGISGFFIGNTAENILMQIDCSILAIKPKEFTTPVTLEN